jgi:hypothetical protein
MAGQGSNYQREVRDTIIKSGLTGVAATVLAVSIFSPAGFGNWVGASLASGFGFDSTADAADNPYANLPAYPTPLSETELSDIRGQLAATAASLELTRASDEAKIEHFRSLELTDGVVTFTPAPRAAVVPNTSLRLTLSEPASLVSSEAPVESYVMEAPVEAVAQPASYSGGGYDASVPYRDPHLELADLLLAHENF